MSENNSFVELFQHPDLYVVANSPPLSLYYEVSHCISCNLKMLKLSIDQWWKKKSDWKSTYDAASIISWSGTTSGARSSKRWIWTAMVQQLSQHSGVSVAVLHWVLCNIINDRLQKSVDITRINGGISFKAGINAGILENRLHLYEPKFLVLQ